MASYSSNANVQNLVYGATNTDLDDATTAARDVATSMINSELNRSTDIASPSEAVTRCATLLAAGIISTGPEDSVEETTYWKAGMVLLKALRGDSSEDSEWGLSVPSERFNGRGTSELDALKLW